VQETLRTVWTKIRQRQFLKRPFLGAIGGLEAIEVIVESAESMEIKDIMGIMGDEA
jgi:hypothetical protein